ncbi:MAG: hypothetical protein U9R53_05215 [Chloroflexota bacterium]|nr:hypothetical protein [Chloroflexota bacterium]
MSGERGEMVQVSPTWRPQTENAMHRLEAVLSGNLIVKDRWEKHFGHVYQVGSARLVFLSGSPTSNIVGATANLLLSVDEAQDIQVDKYDKDIAPMAASTNATCIFWGTAWTSNTLLAREEKAAKQLQEQDGIRRVWRLTCDHVAAEVPPYGKFVADQVAKLGRHHPMVRTQYYSEDIDSEGGLFPPERLALLYGIHPPQIKPEPGQVYVMTLDVAGEDEEGSLGLDRLTIGQERHSPARDATALTIARVNFTALNDPGLLLPSYEIVYRQQWVGIKHTEIYSQILSLAATWDIKYLVCDATGVGAGLTAFLTRSLSSRVIPFLFNSRTKSDLGWAFLSLIDSGRLKTYSLEEHMSPKAKPEWDQATKSSFRGPDVTCPLFGERRKQGFPVKVEEHMSPKAKPKWNQPHVNLDDLHTDFFRQLEYCQYEILPGPDKKIKWSVPDGTRNPSTGDLIHDDLLISAALLSILDQKSWAVTGPAALVNAPDPLEDMKKF